MRTTVPGCWQGAPRTMRNGCHNAHCFVRRLGWCTHMLSATRQDTCSTGGCHVLHFRIPPIMPMPTRPTILLVHEPQCFPPQPGSTRLAGHSALCAPAVCATAYECCALSVQCPGGRRPPGMQAQARRQRVKPLSRVALLTISCSAVHTPPRINGDLTDTCNYMCKSNLFDSGS